MACLNLTDSECLVLLYNRTGLDAHLCTPTWLTICFGVSLCLLLISSLFLALAIWIERKRLPSSFYMTYLYVFVGQILFSFGLLVNLHSSITMTELLVLRQTVGFGFLFLYSAIITVCWERLCMIFQGPVANSSRIPRCFYILIFFLTVSSLSCLPPLFGWNSLNAGDYYSRVHPTLDKRYIVFMCALCTSYFLSTVICYVYILLRVKRRKNCARKDSRKTFSILLFCAFSELWLLFSYVFISEQYNNTIFICNMIVNEICILCMEPNMRVILLKVFKTLKYSPSQMDI